MGERRSWIFLILSLVLAIAAGVAMYGAAQRVLSAAPAPSGEVSDVVVARVDIPARAVVTAEMVALREYPAELAPAAALRDRSRAVGLTALAPIPAGAPLLAAQLVEARGATGASLTLERGKVLVAFPTQDALTAAGLVRAGDSVDILATLVSGPDNSRVTQTIVQNLQVIEVAPPKEPGQRTTLLTFVVDHQTALVLKFLRDTPAAIDLVVRSREEREQVGTTGVDLGYVVQRYGLRRQ